ncbi:hypothetical protein ACFFIX_20565 [Metabacillus herbersteinensis]|uniref:YtzI protein n=1 Tax=Metabacillus herbersteinensis TaxID=283816 RepID=A0ABV6GJC9_9BACI
MNKSLSTFMSLGITAVVLSVLLIGIVYQSLSDKNSDHQDTLKEEYQLKNK